MMRNIKRGVILLMAGIVLTGCAPKAKIMEEEKEISVEQDTEKDTKGELKEEKTEGEEEKNSPANTILDKSIVLETELDDYEPERMEKANGWTNGHMFDCTWREGNVTFEDSIMKLTINSDGENATPKWSGGEYRTRKFYQYGMYEVRMKPIKNDGVVSSFFTYTGPSDSNPWDEIDIEFLGKDTTKVQFNYFTDGVGLHEYIHDLGFDASEEFHTYGFEWLPDSIIWYVDGEAVYTATENIPSTPSKVMMNAWPGTGVDGWLKAFDGTVPLSAEYDWIHITEYKMEEGK